MSALHNSDVDRVNDGSSASSSSSPPPLPSSMIGHEHDRKLTVYYQNVRGLRSKLRELRTNVHLVDFDLFAFTETNLTTSHFVTELGFQNFTVFRCDRSVSTSRKSSGGGVLLAVSHSIPCSQISSNINTIEQVFIRLSLGRLRCVVGLVYIPPASSVDTYSAYWVEVARVRALYPHDAFFLFGDYNLPDISWNTDADFFPSGSTLQSSVTIEQVLFLDLRQRNLVPNHNGRILDLVFSSLHTDECMLYGSSV